MVAADDPELQLLLGQHQLEVGHVELGGDLEHLLVVDRPHQDRVGEPGALDVVDQQVELTGRHLVRVGLILDQRRHRQAQPQQILGLGVGCHGALLVMDSLRDNNGELQLIAIRERKKPPNFPGGPSCLVSGFDGAPFFFQIEGSAMGQILHGSATTTEAIRRAIQNCADAPYERVFRRRSATPVPGFNLGDWPAVTPQRHPRAVLDPAAVGRQDDAADVARGVRAEEQAGVGNVARIAQTPQRHAGCDLVARLGRRGQPRHPFGAVDRTGADGVEAQRLVAPFDRQASARPFRLLKRATLRPLFPTTRRSPTFGTPQRHS